MGRTGQPVLILGVTAIAVAVAGTGVALTRHDDPVARAATTIGHANGAVLVTASGVRSPAHEGQRVPNGDAVHTRSGGSATLVTRGRVVYVGSSTSSATVAVIDGAHQQLRTGTAIVDAHDGPGLTLALAGDVLNVPDNAAAEATRSVTVQVGSLAGSSTLTNTSARTLEIPALYQATVSGDALPSTTTPVHLRYADVPAEALVAPDLVSADRQLGLLARGINVSGPGAAHVVETAWHGSPVAQPQTVALSEQILPMVIASATTEGTLQERYAHVVDWRRAGGSWGVTLGLLSGRDSDVDSALKKLQAGQPAGHLGTFQVAALARPVIHHGSGDGGHASPNPGHSTAPTNHPTAPPTSPGGGSGGSDKPHGPVTKVLGTVGTVVGTVLKLLPGTKPVNGTPSPQPSTSSGGLLKGLLDHH